MIEVEGVEFGKRCCEMCPEMLLVRELGDRGHKTGDPKEIERRLKGRRIDKRSTEEPGRMREIEKDLRNESERMGERSRDESGWTREGREGLRGRG